MLGACLESHPKADLRYYLQAARKALLWKLDGLLKYEIRRPLVPSGTNLFGLVKHVASVELGFLGEDVRSAERDALHRQPATRETIEPPT